MSLMSAYQDLITSQHRGKPKYNATLLAHLQHTNDIFNCAIYIDDNFDVDLAIGDQLNRIGEIVGADRTLPMQPGRGYSPVLDDNAYRNLLKAKIAKNFWKGGTDDLVEIWVSLFGEGIIIEDPQDMTINVTVIGIDDYITQFMIKNGLIVPKPQSVAINYFFSGKAVFGYDIEDDFIKGYDHADWAYENSLPSFAYDVAPSDDMGGYDEGYWV